MSPYAIGKYSSELYSILKSRQTGNKIICIRPFNTFGPYQSEKAIIPEIIIKCLLGKDIVTTPGEQTREFNYVDNIIEGLLIISVKIKSFNKPINLGSNSPIKIKSLVRKIHKISNSKSKLKIGKKSYRPNEIWKMQAQNDFVLKKIKWKPKIQLDEGLDILKDVRNKINVPVISDFSEPTWAKPTGDVVDIIQIPAYLCRQTSILRAAAETKKTNFNKKRTIHEPMEHEKFC